MGATHVTRTRDEAILLLPQDFLHARFGFSRKFFVRDFANSFRKLTRDLANVFQLLHVPLAERTHEIMNAQLHPHHQRQSFFHAERQNPNDLGARRRKPAN